VAELILTLLERDLGRFPIVAVRTTIGRDPSCDVVIDNAGISRLHAAIEVMGDSFVLRDCGSQNGMTLNGEPLREGRLVDGDVIGLNKFLLRFSNEALEVPANLETEPEKEHGNVPRDVQRTMLLGADAAQALAARAKQQIARQRAERAARGGDSLPSVPSPALPRPRASLAWEESEETGSSVGLWIGAVVLGSAMIGGLLWIVL
jgi:pSer/pThr/pTyr-binding forkhead associated (FHA) protein